MADRFLNSLWARLCFAAANLQVLPTISLLLLMAVAWGHLFLLPGRETAIDDAERRLSALERSARRAALERHSVRISPEQTRQNLLAHFPDEAQLNAELGRLIELAGQEGLSVPSGDYRMTVGKEGLFDRYVLNLPVKGSYRAIRRYVQAARTAFPDLAIDDMTLRREAIGSAEVEAQLRFVRFGRKATP